MLSTYVSVSNRDKSSLTAFPQLHVAKTAVQGTESNDVKTEQGTSLFGYLLLRPELRRHPNDSSVRLSNTDLRHRRCFPIDSWRHFAYYCSILSAPGTINH